MGGGIDNMLIEKIKNLLDAVAAYKSLLDTSKDISKKLNVTPYYKNKKKKNRRTRNNSRDRNKWINIRRIASCAFPIALFLFCIIVYTANFSKNNFAIIVSSPDSDETTSNADSDSSNDIKKDNTTINPDFKDDNASSNPDSEKDDTSSNPDPKKDDTSSNPDPEKDDTSSNPDPKKNDTSTNQGSGKNVDIHNKVYVNVDPSDSNEVSISGNTKEENPGGSSTKDKKPAITDNDLTPKDSTEEVVGNGEHTDDSKEPVVPNDDLTPENSTEEVVGNDEHTDDSKEPVVPNDDLTPEDSTEEVVGNGEHTDDSKEPVVPDNDLTSEDSTGEEVGSDENTVENEECLNIEEAVERWLENEKSDDYLYGFTREELEEALNTQSTITGD